MYDTLTDSTLRLENGRIFFVYCDGAQWFVRQSWDSRQSPGHIWLIPGADGEPALHLVDAQLAAPYAGDLTLRIARAQVERHPRFPHADALGGRIDVNLPGAPELMRALAAFYWDTLLPCVVERSEPCYPDGYVLSTLQTNVYGGTYPDVDHEFQCKGRIALGSALDLDLVRRMLELEFKLMREDPTGLYRNPCAIQRDGSREYHVRRNSLDGRTNAEMFLITGNVEVIQSAWLYVALRKDFDWLGAHISELEGAASLTEGLIDRNGRLWSDVYYEDQVMKDGSECMSAALAAHAFGQLGELEALLGRAAQAEHYRTLEARLARQLVRPLPDGFWDASQARFVDWIDRNGEVHDHIHLLANVLPVLMGYCDAAQRRAVAALIEQNLAEYQRFPTFMAARIQDYTPSEIGDGGPYDLCAAGRYWCWDAAYWRSLGRGDMLAGQLAHVAAQAELDNWRMGERYDMNHVYYQSDVNWHGAAYYYEYPNVFAWVLIHDYLGVQPALDADLRLAPLAPTGASVRLEGVGIAYRIADDALEVANLRAGDMQLALDLSAYGARELVRLTLAPGEKRLVSLN